jgi:hypothetical protein
VVGVVAGHESRRTAGVWIFALVLGAYVFSAGGSLTSTDAVVAFDVTRNLVEHGTTATSGDLLGNEAFRGRDGRYYSPFGVAQSIYNIPFYLAGTAFVRMTGISAGKPDSVPKAAVALAQTVLVAGVVWQIFVLSVRLTNDPQAAAMAATTAAFGTVLWPYARLGFNQPLAALALVAAVMTALGGTRTDESRRLALSGWWLALALMTRHEMALAAIPLALWLLVSADDWQTGLRRLSIFAPGIIVGIAAWLLFNAVRFGNPLDSGYLRDTTPGFGSSILHGLAGLLFSPGASLFLYSPAALLGIAGFVWLSRQDRAAATLLIAVSAVFLLFYATLGNWIGGRSWGSRYLVVVIPFILGGFAVLLARISGRARMLVFVVVTTLGVAVQLPGVLIDYAKVSQASGVSYSTAERQWSWSASPLVLNSRALATAIPDNIRYAAGRASPPAIVPPAGDMDRGFSQQFAFSLDFWWLYLFYMGLVPRWGILVVILCAVAWVAYCGGRVVQALRQDR